MGVEVFWPCKYLSMNDEEVAMVRDQCHMIVDGVNIFSKKQLSCKDNSLMENFRAKNIRNVDNMGNRVEDCVMRNYVVKWFIFLRMVWKGPLGIWV